MKKIFLAIVFFVSSIIAGGYTGYETVTNIEVIRNQGFIIRGSFTNVNTCEQNDLYVKLGHPQYNQLYSTALTAMTTGMQIKAYSHSCEYMSWFGKTYNLISESGVLYLKK